MSLEQWHSNSWLQRHEPSKLETSRLLEIAARGLEDASVEAISNDLRFATAYNAALALCTAALHAHGYRVPGGGGHHHRTIESLPLTLGDGQRQRANYLTMCSRKRSQATYDHIDVASQEEVEELLNEVADLRTSVVDWLKRNLPDLSPD